MNRRPPPRVADSARRALLVRVVASAIALAAAICVAAVMRAIPSGTPLESHVAASRAAAPRAPSILPIAPQAVDAKSLARASLASGDAKGAAANASRSIALDPGDGEAWEVFAAASRAMGDEHAVRKAASECPLLARVNFTACPRIHP